jgi:hypothetical protein
VPVGYQTRQIRKRMTRPLHRRTAILEAAEAVFAAKREESKDEDQQEQESATARRRHLIFCCNI